MRTKLFALLLSVSLFGFVNCEPGILVDGGDLNYAPLDLTNTLIYYRVRIGSMGFHDLTIRPDGRIYVGLESSAPSGVLSIEASIKLNKILSKFANFTEKHQNLSELPNDNMNYFSYSKDGVQKSAVYNSTQSFYPEEKRLLFDLLNCILAGADTELGKLWDIPSCN